MFERLRDLVSEAFLPHPPAQLGVAVSGGGDSTALLHLLQQFCDRNGVTLHAVTVDHGLREGSAAEAAGVARHCAAIGVAHDTLTWDTWDGSGNLQKEARDARYALIAAWAQRKGIDTVALGHTADDQAETFVMRLSRRSGVDGLSCIGDRTLRHQITWVRPLLQSRREVLRSYLTAQGVEWVEDPSNDDSRFDRVRAREALQVLEGLGITTEGLAEVASHMSDARKALDWQTFLAAKHIVKIEAGAVIMDETALRLQPDEIQRRIIVRAVMWINGSDYAPRRAAVANVRRALRSGQAGTLDGCHVRRIAAQIWLFREYNAVRDAEAETTALWDGRWHMLPQGGADHAPDLSIHALGQQGLEHCPNWRETGIPHVVLQSTPSIWRGGELVSAPLAGVGDSWHAKLERGTDAFFAALLSH